VGGEDCLAFDIIPQERIFKGSVSSIFCKKIQQSVIQDFRQIDITGNGGGLHGGFQRFAAAL
jgi:hypothetical protein